MFNQFKGKVRRAPIYVKEILRTANGDKTDFSMGGGWKSKVTLK